MRSSEPSDNREVEADPLRRPCHVSNMVPTLLLANRPLLYFPRVRIMDVIVALQGNPAVRRWRRRDVTQCRIVASCPASSRNL
jgi:hypothetical protein